MQPSNAFVSFFFALCCFTLFKFGEPVLPQAEVDALGQITTTMGATFWRFSDDGNSCQVGMVGLTPQAPVGSEARIDCECGTVNNTVCHVVKIWLKGYNLPGVLPPELVELPYLRDIDFAYNYLSGAIPLEWASLQLTSISLLANRLSGQVPNELGNITTLTSLNLEANQFSGTVPPDLGRLVNLETLMLSSNHLTGALPPTLAGLRNLTDFRINDNNFTGIIPNFIQNWRQLKRLEMHASGLMGPIPSNISLLDQLTQLRISDTNGPTQRFPMLRRMAGIIRVVLRSCNISGEIPAYIWNMRDLEMLDVSFNRLVGQLPNEISARSLRFAFLTGNMLSGNIPDSILKDGSSIDFSYNNFTWQGPGQPTCRQNMNLYINLFRSSSAGSTMRGVLPCTNDFSCHRYGCSFHVNSGGEDITIRENNGEVKYEGDANVDGGTSRYFTSNSFWGFSSTGDFMDDNNFQNTRFIENTPSTNISGLYSSARLSPLSLTYFRYCLENGDYTASLHFAEIHFTNDRTTRNLGRRIFDIYIQEELVRKDFNIEDEAQGAERPVVRHFNASVTNNIIEIRFYWAGKGTTRIPVRGVYGPLISAISVNPVNKTCSTGTKKNVTVYVTVGVVAFCIIFSIVSVLWWKGLLKGKKSRGKDFERLELQTVSFTLKQIKSATNNFNSANKVGEGGFGPVYKGIKSDGTVIAVKQLAARSRQGNREFLNEIGIISCLQHPNLVKLHGCCIEGDQLLLVYEYMENNSLANALFGSGNSQLILDWPTRFKICIGVARGLAFLHEESRIKIVHRDIKASNVLLDRDLNPKISDFGLARLYGDDNTHVSTQVAGTIGYMAPEYALWGHLSYKADVYSFGVVALEIVSGKNNNSYIPSGDYVCLLDWGSHLKESGSIEEFVDEKLGSNVNKKEVETMVKVALLCTSASPSLRPIMSEVVAMLEGELAIADISSGSSATTTEDLRFKAMRDYRQRQTESFSGSQTNNTTIPTNMGSSSTSFTTYQHEINPLSKSN